MKKICLAVMVALLAGCFGKNVFDAYKSGDKEYVYDYVRSGGNVCLRKNEADYNISLLTLAIANDDKKLVDLILGSKSFSVEFELSPDGYGWTALHAAAAHRMNHVLVKMLPEVPDVNLFDGTTPGTPLIYAVIQQNYEGMRLLLEHKSMDVNRVNPLDETKLTVSHAAAVRGDLEALKLLKKYGADFSQKNSKGEDVETCVVNYMKMPEYMNEEKEKKLKLVLKYLSENKK